MSNAPLNGSNDVTAPASDPSTSTFVSTSNINLKAQPTHRSNSDRRRKAYSAPRPGYPVAPADLAALEKKKERNQAKKAKREENRKRKKAARKAAKVAAKTAKSSAIEDGIAAEREGEMMVEELGGEMKRMGIWEGEGQT